ncbi:MAG: NYN domain-containing protein, partial [Acidobacteria bacterium]|nr:NYN domain-containing protein [Acidobacteriota bacterium]
AEFARTRRARVTVVFDGAPEQHFADGASYRGVRVCYAERGSNADERIKQLVEAERERRTLLVITSDRELAAYVRRCGAQVVRSGDFRRRMEEVSIMAADAAPENSAHIGREELPEWMRYFGVGPEDEEEDGASET